MKFNWRIFLCGAPFAIAASIVVGSGIAALTVPPEAVYSTPPTDERSTLPPIEYRCTRPQGCVAQIPVGGKLKSVGFRRGDQISTSQGWIIKPNSGWQKVR